ncbi:MAG: hypothetical protein LBF34_03015 [Puniceicoccales bacterium]|jgi:hypothetical protein|nr:hypothetical protein [Puniceicoccales bacterium]
MRKLRLVKIVTVFLGFRFGDMYASSSALLNQAEIVFSCGIEGLKVEWSSNTVTSFQDSAEQCRNQLQTSPLFEEDEQLILVEGRLASLQAIVQDLDEFANTQSEDKKRYLKGIAYRSEPRIQSLILSRINQIEESRNGHKQQSKGGEDKVKCGSASVKVSPRSKVSLKIVKGQNSEKSKK